MRALTSAMLAVLITFPLRGSAQTIAMPGDRVRVQSQDGVVVVGTITAISPDSIILRQEAGDADLADLALPIADVAQIELSLGRQTRFKRNFWLTVAVSSVAVGIAAAVTYREPDMVADSAGDAFGWGAIAGAIYSVPLGVIVGLTVKSERWVGTKISVAPVVGSRLGLVGSISLGGP